MLRSLFSLLFLTLSYSLLAQTGILFNRTEHDFGTIGPAQSAYEQDFLFRNTSDETAHVLSVRSVHPALEFIYTRSEVLAGEYGFVKAKLNTQAVQGLFHDEVYVMLQVGDRVVNEVIFVRAQVDPNLMASNARVFEDSEVAVSVEVTPEDIETMEGFMGGDRLAAAENEIRYLKQQMALKTDLIERLSSDLYNKKDQEAQNIQRLEELENAVRAGSAVPQSEIIGQISILTQQLKRIQASDEKLRQEIMSQEASYTRLQHEADSARAYALQLSAQLQAQFKQQAAAMEKNQRLEADLARKSQLELQQQKQIDSLQQLIAEQSEQRNSGGDIIDALKRELAQKQAQQQRIEDERNRQEQKIDQLKSERAALIAQTDSLHTNLSKRSKENEALQLQLNATSQRMLSYEAMIDSLEHVAYGNVKSSDERQAIDSLNLLLASLSEKDKALKSSIQEKNKEIATLEQEQQQTKKDLRQLELATSRQLEETHHLMHRVNALSKKESKARLEISQLQGELAGSKEREAAAMASVQQLEQQIGATQASIAAMQDSLLSKDVALGKLNQQQQLLTDELNRARTHLSQSSGIIDSLQRVASDASDKKAALESTIEDLQRAIAKAEEEESRYRAEVSDLNAKLKNAKMSNEIVFEELKADVTSMRDERDALKTKNRELINENLELKRAIRIAEKENEMARMAMNEMSNGQSPVACYRIAIVRSKTLSTDLPKIPSDQNWTLFNENGEWVYCTGHFTDLSAAVTAKKYWTSKGYSKANIIGDKAGKLVSLKEAMETAMSGQP